VKRRVEEAREFGNFRPGRARRRYDRVVMRVNAKPDTPAPSSARAAARGPGASPRRRGPSPAQALALQRLVGNRVAGRILARWVKHPDEKEKGVMLPDSSAAELVHLNPPQNS
jgi:hypothetical protein